jgi:hypothetical protein
MVLTREEKEKRILDLYNQGYNTRTIAQETHSSFRDIGAILKRAAQQKELGQVQVERTSISTQAYRLFSEGKSVLQVAIDLQIKSNEAIEYQKEYWELNQLDSLSQLYEEVKGNIWPLVNLYRLSKSSGMNTGQIINLLKIANNDLASVQHKFEQLSRDVISVELNIQNSFRVYQEVSDKITALHKREEQIRSRCEMEEYKMNQLYKKERSLKGFVQFFEDNNETYLTIKKAVEEKVHSTLSNGKMLLKLAVLSLVESMRNNPDKFGPLLYRNFPSSITEYSGQYYGYYMYEQKPYASYNHDGESSVATILEEEAGKLYIKLAKEMVEEITSSIESSSLPLLPSSDGDQGKTPVFSKQNLDYKTKTITKQ